MQKVYFQIGTNNGNDLFNKKCKREKPDKIILVEPNNSLYSEIVKNYKDMDNVSIYSNAIYSKSDEIIKLYIPELKENTVPKLELNTNKITKIGVNNYKYNDWHYSILPMNDWGDINKMETIETTTITFEDICKKEEITKIDYLQIDTEGFDYEIIKMIDFNKYDIKQIRFEKWLFDPSVYTKNFNDKSNELGKNGHQVAVDKLEKSGYILKDINDKDGHDIIATL